jgi:hypothetical protein
MRLAITGKSEKQFLTLLKESGINNPTHLANILVSFISSHYPEEAITYAQDRDNQNQKGD